MRSFRFIDFSMYLLIFFILHISLYSQTTNSLKETPTTYGNKPSELIHFGDLIDVDVIGSTEFDWRGTLTPEGFLNGVDFVDEPIYALCRSENDVANDIANGYKKLLRDPQVSVKIIDRSGRAMSYLYGAVKKPQRFQIKRAVRLNELIIVSGGIDEKASGEIQIMRSSSLNCQENSSNIDETRKNIGSKLIKININDLIKGEKDANPFILNGDIITVTEADPIYVIGGVTNPRQINIHSQMTISRAIASAGGFTKNADLKNIVIFRRGKNGTNRIEIDFNKIKANPQEDLVLQKYDIIEVAQNGAEKRKFAPIVKNYTNEVKNFEMPLRIID